MRKEYLSRENTYPGKRKLLCEIKQRKVKN